MTAIHQLIRRREHKRWKKRTSASTRVGQAGLGLAIVFTTLVACLVVGFASIYVSLTQNLPSTENLAFTLNPSNEPSLGPTRLFDRTGQHLLMVLENPASVGHTYLPIDSNQSKHMAPGLAAALIASQDPGFWRHPGFSTSGILQNTHPTLAQGLVNQFLLWEEPPSIERAVRERILAAQITAQYGKSKILEWYLNNADFGNYAYGVDAAARTYFNKSATELNLAESAALMALTANPEIDPNMASKQVLEQKDAILKLMLEQKLIVENDYKQAIKEPIQFQKLVAPTPNISPAFNQYVLSQLSSLLNPIRVENGGLDIITTLDYDLQNQAQCAAKIQLARISNQTGSTSTSTDQENCEAARLLPTFPPGDKAISETSAEVMILNPQSGQVLAMVDQDNTGDRNNPSNHPPGSMLTPFIYLTALSRGMSPASLLWDIPSSLVEGMTDIQNPDGTFHGPVRLRTALANDYLVPAVQVLTQMGTDQVWQIASLLGLRLSQPPENRSPARVLFEGGNTSLANLVQAYGVFANQGVLTGVEYNNSSGEETDTLHPLSILSVVDRSGKQLLDCTDPMGPCKMTSRPVITSQLAYLINHILSDETARWPSQGHPNPLEIGRPAGAKIGITADGMDSWTIGYTPDLLVGVWTGVDDIAGEEFLAPKWAGGLWHSIIQYATRNLAVKDWDIPAGISSLPVCDPSGLLPSSNCPNVVNEVFLNGSEPTQSDSFYRKFQINRETGRLATILTPPSLIENEVFFVVPPEASTWAATAGLPTVPEAYDVIGDQADINENAQISAPEMFEAASGKITVNGSATGSGFQSYRLQRGKGLNPTSWEQITPDETEPVAKGQLGVWDTTDLNGLYTLQLLVMYREQQVETATVQVIIDNLPPQVIIRYPLDNQSFSSDEFKTITFLAEATDDLDLASVAYFLDGISIGSITSPPFVIPWEPLSGKHTLMVRASDRAGNLSETQINFTVEE